MIVSYKLYREEYCKYYLLIVLRVQELANIYYILDFDQFKNIRMFAYKYTITGWQLFLG